MNNDELKTLNNDGQILNEKKFQRTRKKLKIVAISLDVIGAIMIIAGIMCAIIINVPSMGSSGWFEASTGRTGLIFGLCVPGVVLLSISIPLWLIYHQRNIVAFQTQQIAPVVEEGADKVAGPVIKKITPHVGSLVKQVSKNWNDENQNSDIELKLEQIERLKKSGKISEEEFNQMRKKILGL